MSIYKQTRLKHELSVREMAEIMGVSQALYRMYESGEPPASVVSRGSKREITKD